MMFRKTERKGRKFPSVLGLTVGALAVVGAVSIKNKSKELVSSVSSKVKGMFKKKGDDCMMDSFPFNTHDD